MNYSCRQFSSYARDAVAPGEPGWFANWDRSQFLRIENNEGRREFVLFDADGPGAVVRFWATLAGYGGKGILRFYFDGNETPAIEGDILGVLSGDKLVEYPLSCSVSEESKYLQRGHNLYLPIPYSRHCKITYESDAISEESGAKNGESFYYNINYRTYEPGSRVETFKIADLQKYSRELEQAVSKLSNYDRSFDPGTVILATEGQTIHAGEQFEQKIAGEKAIRKKMGLPCSTHPMRGGAKVMRRYTWTGKLFRLILEPERKITMDMPGACRQNSITHLSPNPMAVAIFLPVLR